MRVLVAQNVPRRHPGGMSRIMEFLHAPLTRDGWDVEFLCAEDVPDAAQGRLGRFIFPRLVRRRVRAMAAAGRPYDIVNVHEPSSAWIAAFRGGTGDPVVVVTTHGVELRAWELAREETRLGRAGPSLGSRVWYPLTSLWQSRAGLRRADAIFCLSFEDRDYLASRLRIAPERITRIFPGAAPLYAEAAANRRYDSTTRLLFAGTWRKNKGIEDLVPAFARLADRDGQVRLTVLGAGAPDDAVRAAFPAAVRDRVTTLVTRNESETAQAFAAHDIFVLPSLFEGTPLTLLEAMMSGLPIVTTATCGMRDVIRDGANGVLIPIRSPDRIVESIARLWQDGGLRERLGRAARADALRDYTWERVAAIVRSAYERLAGARGRRSHGIKEPS